MRCYRSGNSKLGAICYGHNASVRSGQRSTGSLTSYRRSGWRPVAEKRLDEAEIGRYPDGEVTVEVRENVHGGDCFVLWPICTPLNAHPTELLMDALREPSVDSLPANADPGNLRRSDWKNAEPARILRVLAVKVKQQLGRRHPDEGGTCNIREPMLVITHSPEAHRQGSRIGRHCRIPRVVEILTYSRGDCEQECRIL